MLIRTQLKQKEKYNFLTPKCGGTNKRIGAKSGNKARDNQLEFMRLCINITKWLNELLATTKTLLARSMDKIVAGIIKEKKSGCK